MNRNKFYWLLAIGYWLLANQCAQIVTPGGGPKDTKPPRALKYSPDSAAINFKSKRIVILFNEFIQLNDVQKNLLISPPMKKMPDVKVKAKMLVIDLKDSLKKNTTYTFNFGKSIKDYTEGNMLEDFQYVFSTGTYIDSLQLSGKVKNGFDLKTEKDILVMLYDSLNDSVPYKKLPSYFAKTNADGTYKINHIRADTYKVFALKDVNGNYLFDSREESIAFSDSLIKIEGNSKLDLTMFKEEPAKQKLMRANVSEHGHLMFAFIKSTNDSLKLNFLSQKPKENVFYEYSQNKDTLHYWFADDLKDTMKIQIVQGNKIIDTVRLNPITLEQIQNSKRGAKWKLNVKMNVSKDRPFDIQSNIYLKFNHPFFYFNTAGIVLRQDTMLKNIYFLYEHAAKEWSSISPVNDHKNYEISLNPPQKTQQVLKENTSYHLFIPPGTFTDIFGLKNDTIKIDFKTQEEKFYGTLKLNLKGIKSNSKYILQLLDENENVIKQDLISEPQTVNYSYLNPQKYKLKIIYDANGDGKWTSGNHLTHRQPEKVIYFSGDINIRSNWDMELDWKITE